MIRLLVELFAWAIKLTIALAAALAKACAWFYRTLEGGVHAYRTAKNPSASRESSRVIAGVVFALFLGVLFLIGALASPSGQPTHRATASVRSLDASRHAVSVAQAPARKARRRAKPARRPHAVAASRSASVCPAAGHELDGVYHPSRLEVLDPCRAAMGQVAAVRHEEDGDLHIDVALDAAYARMLDGVNDSEQHGDLVVEFMARDGGHLPAPSVGDQISLVGAWVLDHDHGWNELHPVWSVRLNGGSRHTSGPRYGGSPAGDGSSTAAEDCTTRSGGPCHGYASADSGSAPSPPPTPATTTTAATPPTTPAAGGSQCEPGYSPCLPRAADLDCSQIPAADKPVQVTGSDPYRLDADHNGVGCQDG